VPGVPGGLGAAQRGTGGTSTALILAGEVLWQGRRAGALRVIGVQGSRGGCEFAAKDREDDRNPQSLVNSALAGLKVCPGTHPPC